MIFGIAKKIMFCSLSILEQRAWMTKKEERRKRISAAVHVSIRVTVHRRRGTGCGELHFLFYLYIIFIFSFAGVLRLAANEHELILSQPMRSIALRGGNRPKRYGQSKKFENPPCLREATWPNTWHV